MITVSVILPCLNIKKTIKGCLNSINKQKYSQLTAKVEVICIIDGNYEDMKYIESWEKENKNMLNIELRTIFLKKNIGAGHARFIGFQECTGEFITFIDDDDIWHEEKLETQIKWHISNPTRILSSHFYSNGIDYMNKRMKILKEVSFNNLLIGGVRIATPTIMIRKNIWPFQPEKQRFCEDWLMVAMVASIQKIYVIPRLLAFRSYEAEPIFKDKSSLSNKKIRVRCGKVKALFILYKRDKISLLNLITLIIVQFFILIKNIPSIIKTEIL